MVIGLSVYGSVIWPCVPLVVEEHMVGTAYPYSSEIGCVQVYRATSRLVVFVAGNLLKMIIAMPALLAIILADTLLFAFDLIVEPLAVIWFSLKQCFSNASKSIRENRLGVLTVCGAGLEFVFSLLALPFSFLFSDGKVRGSRGIIPIVVDFAKMATIDEY